MPHDPTVVLDKDAAVPDIRAEAQNGQRGQLSGKLLARNVEFSWQARSLYGLWFVSVSNATCGSRSQLTQDDPINFALQLAKQLARPQLSGDEDHGVTK